MNPSLYSICVSCIWLPPTWEIHPFTVSRCLHFLCLILRTGCSAAEEGNVQFPYLLTCQAASHPCVKYHPKFKGGSVVRKCNKQGETLALDFSNCSVLHSDFSTPFAVVSFTFSGTRGSRYTNSLPAIKRDVSQIRDYRNFVWCDELLEIVQWLLISSLMASLEIPN